MGAGASALEGGALEGVSSADAGALADTNLSLSSISPTTREIAVRLKDALCTPSGWKELQSLFKTLAADLDDAVPSHEWGQMVFENEEVRAKYFGDAGPEEIAAQFESFDAEYVATPADGCHLSLCGGVRARGSLTRALLVSCVAVANHRWPLSNLSTAPWALALRCARLQWEAARASPHTAPDARAAVSRVPVRRSTWRTR